MIIFHGSVTFTLLLNSAVSELVLTEKVAVREKEYCQLCIVARYVNNCTVLVSWKEQLRMLK